MAKTVILAVAFVAICRAQEPQPSRGAGRISGQVTSVTGGPVKNAVVRLIALASAANGSQTLDTYNTNSDATGNFAFESVPAGRYEVRPEHGGYMRNSAAVTLYAGQPVTGVSIKLTPEGRIEGTITDEDGEPAPEGRVLVLRWAAANGLKRLVDGGGNGTQGVGAPDGSFVTGGLEAGFYYVCADVERGNNAPRGRSAHEAYIPTFYPGVSDLASATLIKVEAGAVVRGVNIRLQRAAVHRFRAKAIDNRTNTPAAGMSIDLLPGSLRMIQRRSANTQEDGSFEIDALPPGEYTVQVGYARPPASGQAVRLFAAPIVIGNRDVEDGIVRLTAAIEVDGKVTFEGNRGSPTPPNLTVGLYSASGNAPSASTGKDSTFVIHDVGPDRYLITIAGLSAGTYVKAVRFGDEGVSGKMIDLTSAVGGALEIVLAPRAASVGGSMQDSKGNPLPGLQVSLWKPGRQFIADGAFVPLDAITDQGGAFHFNNLAPGEYRVAAWAGSVAVLAPDFLSQFDSAAAVVKLQEGSRESIDAPMIPQDAIESALGNLR